MGLASFNRARRLATENTVIKPVEMRWEESIQISFNELRAKAKELKIEGYGKMTKEQLIEAIEGDQHAGKD